MALAVPEELMTRFRVVAMERLERIDGAWTALVRGETGTDQDAALLRDVHTLKGDAKVVGLVEASLLCQRLEDLLIAACARGYRVHEDVDIVVTMTIQFIAMLVRKRSTAGGGGIDLKGFLKQIEEVMSEWLRRSSEAPDRKLSVGPHLRVKDRDRLTPSSGLRLSVATTAVYLEHLRVRGDTRARLRETWQQLLLGVLDAHRAPLASLVAGHVSTAKEIAGSLGKKISVSVDGDDTSFGPETADVLGVVLVHALRNAIDHGIETPDKRRALGKPESGAITVTLSREGELARLVVDDDGAGIDVERVRARAVERGLLSAEMAAHASLARIIECLFSPGFTTREEASEISGRGIGLDAVYAAVDEAGGTIALASEPKASTTLTVTVPDVRGAMEIVHFSGSKSNVRFGVPASFHVRRSDRPSGILLEDVFRLPQTTSGGGSPLSISGEGVSLTVEAGSKGTLARALRKCPTPAEELVEIVWIPEGEVVLVRPEVLNAKVGTR